jgi:CHAT domain-containing protein
MVIPARSSGCPVDDSTSRCALRICVWMFLLSLVTWTNASPAFSNSSPCSEKKLEEAIRNHNEHVFRMNRKFKDVWYYQGKVPDEIRNEITIKDIPDYLKALHGRSAAVLFHSVNDQQLCSWLITPSSPIVRGEPRLLSGSAWKNLKPTLWTNLGVRSVRVPRVSRSNPERKPLSEEESLALWRNVLQDLSSLLLPLPIPAALLQENIDTLIIVPVSLREANLPRETEETSATDMSNGKSIDELPPANRLLLAISTVPFLALPIGNGEVLADRMSVIVSPGFFIFGREPPVARRTFREPIVVGAPERDDLNPLPGALVEAQSVAKQLGTTALTERAAKKQSVLERLDQRAANVDFLLFSTHGIASQNNPIDESYLEFSDGALNAREISAMREPVPVSDQKGHKGLPHDRPRLKRGPLVVMSACQTGLGKDFAVGTIGLARAFQWAGASNVVMSLWSVDDAATRLLIDDFVGRLLEGMPSDRALRSAALKLRNVYRNPAFWAAFNVFGAPELMPRE